MLELSAVTKVLGGRAVLDRVSLRPRAGATTALIGPSGCGKSTVLRLMIGLLSPDEGRVLFDGRTLGEAGIRSVRARTGYVIQSGGLFPHMTAHRNITLAASRRGWSRDRIEARLGELVGLTRFPADGLERYPAQLSGGQRQRVSLMRALMTDPDVLLLDEPLGALDPMIRAELQGELRRIFEGLGKTVVVVTHDLAEAAFLAQEIVLMRAGEIVQTGTLAEMTSAPSEPFVTTFVSAQRERVRALLEAGS